MPEHERLVELGDRPSRRAGAASAVLDDGRERQTRRRRRRPRGRAGTRRGAERSWPHPNTRRWRAAEHAVNGHLRCRVRWSHARRDRRGPRPDRPLLHPLLGAAGHHPVALVRSDNHRPELEAAGAEVRLLDIEREDATAFARAFDGCHAVVFAAGGGPDGNIERKRTVDLEGSLKSIDGARAAGIPRFVQVSAIDVDEPVAATPARSGRRTSRPSATPMPRCAPPISTGRSFVRAGSPTRNRPGWWRSASTYARVGAPRGCRRGAGRRAGAAADDRAAVEPGGRRGHGRARDRPGAQRSLSPSSPRAVRVTRPGAP